MKIDYRVCDYCTTAFRLPMLATITDRRGTFFSVFAGKQERIMIALECGKINDLCPSCCEQLLKGIFSDESTTS